MKYEPKNSLTGYNISETEILMMPFLEMVDAGPDWNLVDVIAECVAALPEKDQQAIYGVFYDRQTYEELSDTLGIKAKSHAWRRTRQALEKLKDALLAHPEFIERTNGKYS